MRNFIFSLIALSFIAPSSAFACGMYIPDNEVNLADLFEEIDAPVMEEATHLTQRITNVLVDTEIDVDSEEATEQAQAVIEPAS